MAIFINGIEQGGGSSFSFSDNETPSGAIDGINDTFSLANTPSPSSNLKLYSNGMILDQGDDYTLVGNTITFILAAIPQSGDKLMAFYRF